MTRQRLRPTYSHDELTKIYETPHQHGRWNDHKIRVAVTSNLAAGLLLYDEDIASVADLSCGDGTIARSLHLPKTILGDFAPGYKYQGPLEQTIEQIDPVDIYVCSETLEHVDNPDSVLALIRAKSRYLVLSTPVDAWNETNPEHYWAWARSDVEEMLIRAGFTVLAFNALDMRPAPWSPYCFGIWLLK